MTGTAVEPTLLGVPPLAFNWRRLLLWSLLLPMLVRAPPAVIVALVGGCYLTVPVLSYMRRNWLHDWPSRRVVDRIMKIGNNAAFLVLLGIASAYFIAVILREPLIKRPVFLEYYFYSSYPGTFVKPDSPMVAGLAPLYVAVSNTVLLISILFMDITLPISRVDSANGGKPSHKGLDNIPFYVVFASLPLFISFGGNKGTHFIGAALFKFANGPAVAFTWFLVFYVIYIFDLACRVNLLGLRVPKKAKTRFVGREK